MRHALWSLSFYALALLFVFLAAFTREWFIGAFALIVVAMNALLIVAHSEAHE